MREYDAFELARMADVTYPDTKDSPGAKWLLDVQDAYTGARETIREAQYPEDELSDLADSSVPVGTHETWQVFLDLCLYQVESDLIGEKSAKEFLSDGPGILLYEVASTLLGILYQEDTRSAEDSGEGDEM